MKKTKEQKGITLIALIITIVVLMILAAVAINSITNDGIISKAEGVADKYTEEQKREQDILDYYEALLSGMVWTQNGTQVSRNGQTLNVGDYVSYESGVEGYNDKNGWRVLGVEYGKLLLLSNEAVKEDLKITSSDYLKDMKGLDSSCEDFGKGEFATGARSIDVNDINRVTGYNPAKTRTGKAYTDVDTTLSDYGTKVTYKLNADGYVECTWTDSTGKTTTSDFNHRYNVFNKVGENTIAPELSTAEGITIQSDYYTYSVQTMVSDDEASAYNLTQTSDFSELYDMGKPANFLFYKTNGAPWGYWLDTPFVKARKGAIMYGVYTMQWYKLLSQVTWNTFEDLETNDTNNGNNTAKISVRAVVSIDHAAKVCETGTNGVYKLSW